MRNLLLFILVGCIPSVGSHAATPDRPPLDRAVRGYVLPPRSAPGSDYCLDPDSAALRRALTTPPPDPAQRVDARDLARDVQALRAFLEAQYVGWSELDAHLRGRADDFFDGWARSLRRAPGAISVQEGLVAPMLQLRARHRDLHLAPDGYGSTLADHPDLVVRELQTSLLPLLTPAPLLLPDDLGDDGAPDEVEAAPVQVPPPVDPMLEAATLLASCDVVLASGAIEPGTLRVAVEVGAAGARTPIATVSATGATVGRLVCPAGSLPLVARADAPALPDGPVYELEVLESDGQETAIVTVRRLHGDLHELELLRGIAKDYPSWADADRVIFDFRGNGGGDDAYVWDWVKAAARGRFQVGENVEKLGAVGTCSAWNWRVTSHVLAHEIDSPAARDELAQLKTRWQSLVPDARSRRLTLDAHADRPFHGEVMVLVDRRSVSSGERGPELLALTTGAVVVGERTGGFMEYGGIRSFVLPRTGLVFQVPTRRHRFPEPREGVGLAVPVYLEPELLGRPAAELAQLLPWTRTAPARADADADAHALPSGHEHAPRPPAVP